MSTIMTSADGKRRCDGTCHGARHLKCGCICMGRYHGASVNPAKKDERSELEEIILKKVVAKDNKPLPESTEQETMNFGDANGQPEEV